MQSRSPSLCGRHESSISNSPLCHRIVFHICLPPSPVLERCLTHTIRSQLHFSSFLGNHDRRSRRRLRAPRRRRRLGRLHEGPGRLAGDLEGGVAVDVEPSAADEEHDVVGQVENRSDGGKGEEKEDEGPY